MASFTAKDVNPMGWDEFDRLIKSLVSQVSAHFGERREKVDVVTPLLRTGGVVGSVMAVKLRVFTMLPVQFKYSYDPITINKIISIPDILAKVPEEMNILLCEANTNTGLIAMRTATEIKAKYPKAKIFHATLTKVFGGPENLDGIEKIFYGQLTDENFKATDEERDKLSLRKGITVFPWENIEEELADTNALR